MAKPVASDPCGSNSYAAWESKLYVVVCGGIANAVKIITKPVIVLSLGIETSVEDFFDPHYLMRNLASLFGIPAFRLRIPKIVPGSALLDVEIGEVDACDTSLVPTCGAHGRCYLGECDCDDGWRTPADCADGGDCSCSKCTKLGDEISCFSCADACERESMYLNVLFESE